MRGWRFADLDLQSRGSRLADVPSASFRGGIKSPLDSPCCVFVIFHHRLGWSFPWQSLCCRSSYRFDLDQAAVSVIFLQALLRSWMFQARYFSSASFLHWKPNPGRSGLIRNVRESTHLFWQVMMCEVRAPHKFVCLVWVRANLCLSIATMFSGMAALDRHLRKELF